MIWQDIVILIAQSAMFVALIPTLRDRSRWPHRATACITSAALLAVAIALLTLDLWLSAGVVLGLAGAWGRMARG